MASRKTAITLVALLAILSTGSAVIASAIFTQTFPAVGSSSAVTGNCATLTAEGTVPAVGSSGTILFDCAGSAAFAATGGSATPTFALPAQFGGLSYVAFSSGATTCSAGTALTSGSPATPAAGSYSYCATYTSWPSSGSTSFSITWAA